MPKLTIIGTSHAGALKSGWDKVAADHPDWTVAFFAAATHYFRRLHLTKRWRFGVKKSADTGSQLAKVVRTVNGVLSTDLASADVVLWAGFGRPLTDVVGFVGTQDVEGLLETGAGAVLPRAEFDAFCDQLIARSMPEARWLGRKRPRLVLHNSPNPDASLLDADGEKLPGWAAFARRPGDKRPLFDAFHERYTAALSGVGVALLRQPATTLEPSGLTGAAFARGSRRLRTGKEHGETDHSHMNAHYGALALTAFFDMAGPLLAEPVPEAPTAPRLRRAGRRPDRAAVAARRSDPKRRAVSGEAVPAAGAAASPYEGLPPRAYWRSGVAERAPLDPGDLYRPRFPVTRATRIATAGSCFAQHVGRALRGAGFAVLDAEPRPPHVAEAAAAVHGYGLFSGRYGNIYTARQLAQLFEETESGLRPTLPVWRKGDRFVDAQRPGVEPEGLASEAEVLRQREGHLATLRGLFRAADLFVFTFGLTEAWIDRASGTVYPTAPGTIAGTFDPGIFAFKNYDAVEVLADFEVFRTGLKAINPAARFLVTVSPVPLTATATAEHVEVATCQSKATLRAACGMLVARHDDVDYFPSFEIITSQNARGAYYEPNLRNVSPMGVAAAMRLFLSAHGAGEAAEDGTARKEKRRRRAGSAADDPCEEALLEAFAR